MRDPRADTDCSLSDGQDVPGGGPHRALAASAWVCRFIGGAGGDRRVLDVACGGGRHLALALGHVLAAMGVDRDLAAARSVQPAAGLELVEADLEQGGPPPFRGRTYGCVIVTNYLWRPLLADIVAAVAPDGILIYETFALGQERLGRPRNPDFLLRPGELLDAVAGRLTTMAYEHVRLEAPARIVQRIAAVGPAHRWLSEGPPAVAVGPSPRS